MKLLKFFRKKASKEMNPDNYRPAYIELENLIGDLEQERKRLLVDIWAVEASGDVDQIEKAHQNILIIDNRVAAIKARMKSLEEELKSFLEKESQAEIAALDQSIAGLNAEREAAMLAAMKGLAAALFLSRNFLNHSERGMVFSLLPLEEIQNLSLAGSNSGPLLEIFQKEYATLSEKYPEAYSFHQRHTKLLQVIRESQNSGIMHARIQNRLIQLTGKHEKRGLLAMAAAEK
jgi:hypothetical protein